MGSKRNVIFLGFTFTLTWISWWLLAYLTQSGLIEFNSAAGQVILIIGGSAPTVGAYLAVARTQNYGSLREFNSRVFKVKVKPGYYLFAIFTPVVLGLMGLVLAIAIDKEYLLHNPTQPVYIFATAFLLSIVMGGIEEVGWRGVLQPSLTGRFNLFTSNYIIGIIWALWHLPFFYIVGTAHQGNSFLLFALAAIGFSSFLTWLYAKTNSIFLCILFHASINATAVIGYSITISETPAYILSAVAVFVAGNLFLLLAPKLPRNNTANG